MMLGNERERKRQKRAIGVLSLSLLYATSMRSKKEKRRKVPTEFLCTFFLLSYSLHT
jgi:hypothetical protein